MDVLDVLDVEKINERISENIKTSKRDKQDQTSTVSNTMISFGEICPKKIAFPKFETFLTKIN